MFTSDHCRNSLVKSGFTILAKLIAKPIIAKRYYRNNFPCLTYILEKLRRNTTLHLQVGCRFPLACHFNCYLFLVLSCQKQS